MKISLEPRMISKRTASELLGVDDSKINKLIEVGLLTCRADKKTHYIFVCELDELLLKIRKFEKPTFTKNPKQREVLTEYFYQPTYLNVSLNLSSN